MTDLARAVREAILTFEPRILPATLQIRTLLEGGDLDHHNVIGVEILGELWAQPVPLEFLVRTEFDLETGKVQIADLGRRRGWREWTRASFSTTTSNCSTCARRAPNSPSSFRRLRPGSGCTGWRSTIPYVERLLEGVGFLAARVQLKLEAEFPRFTQALLEIVYPHYLAPTPSMLVAQLQPDKNEPGLASGARTVSRGTTMHSVLAADDVTACEFRTAHDVTLWPVEIVSASYFSFAPDLPLNSLPIAQRIKGGLRIRLKTTAGLRFAQTAIDRLCFYLAGRDDVANKLYELCLASGLGTLVLPSKSSTRWHEFLPAASIRPVGFTDAEALLPVTLRSFQGYRLLQEYFSFPQRFRFFELTGLARALKRVDADQVELVILLGRGEPTLESVVDSSNLALFCTPALNLFPKRADRIHVSDSAHEYHVVPDRSRPLDFEVYAVTNVVGHGIGTDSEQQLSAVLLGVQLR